MTLSTRSPSPTADITSSSFLNQPVEDLVLLHSFNTLLSSVSLPTLHNILDATPNLLILLYEALPHQSRRRRRVPFVDRKVTGGGDFGARLKNLKLLVGTIAHDEKLSLSRCITKRLAELDLAGFCEKDHGATREVLGVLGEIFVNDAPKGSELGDAHCVQPKHADLRGLLQDAMRETPPESVATSFLEEISFSVGSMLAHSAPASLATAPLDFGRIKTTCTTRRGSPWGLPYQNEESACLGVEDGANIKSLSGEAPWSPIRYRHRYIRTQMPRMSDSLPPLLSGDTSPIEVNDYYDETDVSSLPLPPSPPPQTRYLALKGREYFSKYPSPPHASLISTATLQQATQEPAVTAPNLVPVPRITDKHGQDQGRVVNMHNGADKDNGHNDYNDYDEDDGNDSDDDRTTLVSVSPASWGQDSPFTASLREKRTEALRRLRRAEKRFQEQVEAKENAVTSTTCRMEEKSEKGVSILGYEDIQEELKLSEEDGTVQVEKLEGLVRALLVGRGYRIVDEPVS